VVTRRRRRAVDNRGSERSALAPLPVQKALSRYLTNSGTQLQSGPPHIVGRQSLEELGFGDEEFVPWQLGPVM
jgi:hypothetical protein